MAPTIPNNTNQASSYPPHILAQKLNNRGAQFVEAKQFDRAIIILAKALRISERLAAQSISCCHCSFCTLDQCMSVRSSCRHVRSQLSASTPPQQQQQQRRTRSSPPSNPKDYDDENVSCGYVYSEPIYVPPIPLQEGHEMGITLSLIVIFNLALAHQLSAAATMQQEQQQQERPSSATANSAPKMFGKASQLYELAYQLQLEQCSHSCGHPVNSLRFSMTIANNLGQIHRLVHDHEKHAMCMQHLLSAMMMYLVLDCQHYHLQEGGCIEFLEGFFRNTSHIILQDICAKAA